MFLRPQSLRLEFLAAMAGLAFAIGCTKPGSIDAPSAVATTVSSHAKAERHREAGRQLAAEGQYEAAIVEYSAAIDALRTAPPIMETDAPDADLLVARGLAYLATGFPDTAAADFSASLRIQPDHGLALVRRGEAHAQLQDYFKAVRDCTDGLRHGGPAADAHRYRGEAYLARGNFDRAAADLEEAIQLDPALGDALRPMMAAAYRGWSQELAETGAAEDAAAKLARADSLDPTAAGAATGAQDLFGGGVERTVAKVILDEARDHYERGLQAYSELRFDEALASFTTAIERRPDFAEAYLARAKTLMAMDFPDTAVADLDEAIRYGGEAVEPLWLKAQAFMMLENPNRAVLSATDALHLDPTIADCYAVRGRAYVALDNWERAAADLEEAIRRDAGLAAELTPFLDKARRLEAAAQARQAGTLPGIESTDPTVNRPSA